MCKNLLFFITFYNILGTVFELKMTKPQISTVKVCEILKAVIIRSVFCRRPIESSISCGYSQGHDFLYGGPDLLL